jgi:carbamoyltransferase
MAKNYILGLSFGYHDSAAALISEGQVIAAVQEERLTRIKADSSFPYHALLEVLKISEIDLQQIHNVIFYEKPFLKFERIVKDFADNFPYGLEYFASASMEWIGKGKVNFLQHSIKKFRKEPNYEEIYSFLKNQPLLYSHHHLSHAASAFFPSGFREATVIVVDAVGEFSSSSIWIGTQKKLNMVKEFVFPHSIGVFYSLLTSYLGFKPNSGEYKVMGLAPFGRPIYLNDLMELFEWKYNLNTQELNTILNLKKINPIWRLQKNLNSLEKFFNVPPRTPESPITQFYADIAASLQELTNKYMLDLANFSSKLTGKKNLVMAGGVALNCVSNEFVRRNGDFAQVWIQPAAGDAGAALGAAYAFEAKQEAGFDFSKIENLYLGREFTNAEINAILLEYNLSCIEFTLEELIKSAAKDLADGMIIGWFHGRAEFGPRALGNRSILARPDSKIMQKKLNLKIKFRESFRPFAPAIKLDKFADYFEGEADPFMIRLAKSKDFKPSVVQTFDIRNMLDRDRSLLQAVTHLDGTARVQTVDKVSNCVFYDLLTEFEKLTNLPVLINTSFNTRGEPIVYSPKDALLTFARSEIDALYIGGFKIYRKEISKELFENSKRIIISND